MGTRTQHWESFCLWLPIQTGQDLKSEVENDCWVANFWDLTNPKETHHWFCTLSSQKLSFQCSQETFSPLTRTWAGFSWETPQSTIFWKDTQYILFPLIDYSQCSFCEGISTHSTKALRPGGLQASSTSRSQFPRPKCLWTPWHSSPWQTLPTLRTMWSLNCF